MNIWQLEPRGTSQWYHNERDGVSNHRRLGCLLNRLFRLRSKKISKLRVTGLYGGNSPVTPHKGPVTWKFVFILWRHHGHVSFPVPLCVSKIGKPHWRWVGRLWFIGLYLYGFPHILKTTDYIETRWCTPCAIWICYRQFHQAIIKLYVTHSGHRSSCITTNTAYSVGVSIIHTTGNDIIFRKFVAIVMAVMTRDLIWKKMTII